MDYFEKTLDEKNRFTVPSELRHEFEGQKLFITRGFKNYLHLYTEKVWNEKMEPQLKGDILDERIADLNVQFRLGKQEAVMTVKSDNRQCRIAIDHGLMEYANIPAKGAIQAVRAGDYWRLTAKN
jgi:DNA-binding transcriptional regulator/RsmH inhibitor MraZ